MYGRRLLDQIPAADILSVARAQTRPNMMKYLQRLL